MQEVRGGDCCGWRDRALFGWYVSRIFATFPSSCPINSFFGWRAAGIGPDGHSKFPSPSPACFSFFSLDLLFFLVVYVQVAFNEPGSALTSRTRVKTLAYETIIANARFFEGDITKV